jgi:transcriptional regulator with XRE-family HTH domain
MLSEIAEKMSFTSAQCRAARALLNWSQEELATASRIAIKTIADFERGSRAPYARTLSELQSALEAAGIEFTNGGEPGVRMRIEDQIDDETLVSEVDIDQFWILRGGRNPVPAHETSLRKALQTAKCLRAEGTHISSIRDLRDRTIWRRQFERLWTLLTV